MDIFANIIIGIHILLAVAICIFVLLQHGKGADLGAAFGSGASGSIFGAQGSANFLSRTTAVLVALFFVTSIGLTYLNAKRSGMMGGSVIDQITPAVEGTVIDPQPAAPPAPTLPSDVPQNLPESQAPKAATEATTTSQTASDVPKAVEENAAQKPAGGEQKPAPKP